jgi:cytochrome c2
VVAQAGCLACHKIGENGNDGPGPPLTTSPRACPSRRSPAR